MSDSSRGNPGQPSRRRRRPSHPTLPAGRSGAEPTLAFLSDRVIQVPPEYRKCGFYKLANEYAGVVAGQGMEIGRYGSVEQRRKLNRGEVEVEQRRKTPDDAQKMDKLIKQNEWILITNVAVVVIVSLGLLVMLVK